MSWQVFINMFLNAIAAMPDGGKLFVRSYSKTFDKPQRGIGVRSEDLFKIGEKAVLVEIEDTGVGISEENLKKIFSAFFTTKGSMGGTGLGLAVTRNIIDMHKGLVAVESRVGKGTKFTITFKMQGG